MTYVPLPRALPHERGVDARGIVDFLAAVAEAGLELHSFMLYRQGAVVTEAFWQPYSARRKHVQHSATKSWTATAVGLLVDDGRLKLNDTVISFFPELCPVEVSANLAAMTVEDLLTMRTGHQRGISGGAWRNLQSSWVAAFLQEPVDEPPGKSFIYSSASSFMLSAIVTQVSGQTMHALLEERVLGFLGLDPLEWDLAPGGFNSGGNGLSCTTEDSLKFGVLHLNQGQWQGRQLLSPKWIGEATRNQVEDVWMGEFDGKQYLPRSKDAANEVPREGYGYQWWMTKHEGYYASGVFGQYCIVLPEQDTVIAFTCGLRLGERRLHAALWEHLFPALGRDATDPKACQAQLDALLEGLRLPMLQGLKQSSSALALQGRFAIEPNEDGVREIAFDFQADYCDFSLVDHRGSHHLRIGLQQPIESSTSLTGNYLHHQYQPEQTPVIAHGCWAADGELLMDWRFVETAFADHVSCRVQDGCLLFDRGVNTNAGSMQRPTLTGSRL
ncbi:serine hydrolase [Pseudomonas sp. CCM 7891]|uniref:Serine hydrolase n=1 Tax=Pseudomonas karstica TaxID=1055468 RepID=A0A7X2RTV9_9PSED|nr:serine hydrolase [Pseudomonas karstica]MTD20749.1 serine hydrolase [Pseudomonas karstica]